jgi:hypothetical protein
MTARRQLALCIAGCYPDYLRTRRDGWRRLSHYFCFGMQVSKMSEEFASNIVQTRFSGY